MSNLDKAKELYMKAQPTIRLSRAAAIGFLLLWSQSAHSQSFSSGSTGADGPLTAGATITVRPGGVYHHTTVNIPSGQTLRYLKGSDNSPVVILATGDVTIAGSVIVTGSDGTAPHANTGAPSLGASAGPGGFNGGNGGYCGTNLTCTVGNVPPSAGWGPGGGASSSGSGGQGGTYGAPTSFVSLLPLFGGSGGGGGAGVFFGGVLGTGGSGAGGGGAIVIASSTKITVNGAVRANGGNAGPAGSAPCTTQGAAGTGGAIRLVAPEIAGSGATSIVQAIGGTGGCAGSTAAGLGRIRLEAFTTSGFTGTTNPVPSIATAPGPASPAGNPALSNVPTLQIASIAGTAVPATQNASYFVPDMALPAGTANPVAVVVNATNTPVGSPTAISVRLMPQAPGAATNVAAADHTGTFASSSATVNVTLPVGQVSLLQAIAAMTLTGQTASLFPLIDGEPVERVAVAATPGQPSAVSLVTKSGREVRLDQLPFEDQLRVAQAWEVMKATRLE